VFAIVIASLILGTIFARFNIFAVLIGAAALVAGVFLYDLGRGVVLAQALLEGLAAALALQVAYLVAQFLRRSQN
jgi:hypothetical protein